MKTVAFWSDWTREASAKCQKFNTCSANICPLDPEMERRSWFLGEGICTKKEFAKHPVVKAQKWLEKQVRRGRKTAFGKKLDEEETWYGRDLLELAQKLQERSEQYRERALRLMAEGKFPIQDLKKRRKN